MKKQIPRDTLLELIARFPTGVSVEEIILGLDPEISRRTLQRWLAGLVQEGVLVALGHARSRKYRIKPEQLSAEEEEVPLSEEGRIVLLAISQPIHVRKSVTYRREFLDDYEPNISFYLPENLRKKLMQLGTHNGHYPAGTYARQIFDRLLIDLSWNSSRLEGNTYSLLETQRLLEQGKAAVGKNLHETQMILNHKSAIEFLVQSNHGIGINRFTILNLHALLSENLLSDPSASGRLRFIPVGIAKSVYQPSAIPQVVEDCFDLIIKKASAIIDPFEQAFFMMVHLPYLQPFDDVNKRTSRLAANIPLIQNNLCPLSFIDVPDQIYIHSLLGVYELGKIELLRDVFCWAYERSCLAYALARQFLGEPDPFRMQHREAIQQMVRQIVLKKFNKQMAIQSIREYARENLSPNHQARFIEIVERELQALHAGNIARYQLRLEEFEEWKKSWE